ncbi:hypothetical protein QTP70_015131 [Hemibagrus guttatus]|uniref:Reverse transcriptase domain-containing protein n=1 Tax=Hemibagrus guttatus TaxID=175788 RepID=A0AAE0V1N8_9TELE|nr:hypothetical protein QTP70_015131 [Hemibagrus guttatus]
MAALAQHEAQHLPSFCDFAVFILLISGLFTQNSLALTSYTQQELLDIGVRHSDSFIADLQLIPEISRTLETTHPTRPGGSGRRRCRGCKQRWGKHGGLRAKLKLILHRLSLPSIILANVRSLVNKMDEIRLHITQSKRLSDCNVMIFTETWLHGRVPDNAIELAGRHTLRADRSPDGSGGPEEHRGCVSTVLHSVLTHLDNNNKQARVLFVDFSSAFNTAIPSKLTTKLGDLRINTSLRNWTMDFLTNRPQHVRSGHICSTTITLNTGVPQGCVLSLFLYSLFTHDCRPVYGSNSIIKFADDTMVIGLISDNNETT